MLSLSQTAGYAIRALGCLADTDGAGRWVLARDIAGCTGIPKPYLSKILHSLVRAGLVQAKRGYRGGFALARPGAAISLLDVVKAVEGEAWAPRCLLGLAECSDDRSCPTHAFWSVERERIADELQRISLDDVAAFERHHGRGLGSCDCADGRSGGAAGRVGASATNEEGMNHG